MQVNEELIRRYKVRTNKISNGPKYWDSLLCEIFEYKDYDNAPENASGIKIGEYTRNHYSLCNTFHPFEQNGKHYALYSKDYTATRVMSLPDCKDIAGEEPHPFGFCPTGYAVPYFKFTWQGLTNDPADPEPADNPNWAGKQVIEEGYVQQLEDRRLARPGDSQYTGPRTKEEFKAKLDDYLRRHREWDERHPEYEENFNARFGFVCGCIWGDDTSWKIEYLDLSRISEGILVRDDRFGYIELFGSAANLKNAIDMDGWAPDHPFIRVSRMEHLRTDGVNE